MLRSRTLTACSRQLAVRYYSSGSPVATESPAAVQQAPNRKETWAISQKPKSEAQVGPRFVQKDLSQQPKPLAAIELIAKQPIRFLDSDTAVCDGEKGSQQGHPRIYINLDKPGAHDCLYCGLRYAHEKHRKDLE